MRFFARNWNWLFVLLIVLIFITGVIVYSSSFMPEGFIDAPAAAVQEATVVQIGAQWEAVPGAVTICADGEPLCTLANLAEAELVLNAHMEQMQKRVPEGETLLSAAFAREMVFREAVGNEASIRVEDALLVFSQKPALCPVRVVTETVLCEAVPFETKQEEDADKRLPKGVRFVLAQGREGARASVSERTYVNGVLQGAPHVEQALLSESIPERIALGGYAPDKSSGEPGRKEGERGKAAPEGFVLKAPVKGDILSNFGMRNGQMHYGLNYDAKAGDEIIAPAAGTVCYIGERGAYGLVIEIEHGDGFKTRIAPMQDLKVKMGDTVNAAQAIGVLAPPIDEEAKAHLHMELLIDGIPYNPRQYF